MNEINPSQTNQYLNAFNENMAKASEHIASAKSTSVESIDTQSDSKLHNAAVNVSISTHSIMNYLKVKSAESSQGNTNAQQILTNLVTSIRLSMKSRKRLLLMTENIRKSRKIKSPPRKKNNGK